jgi:hypothetical protein
MNKVFIFRNYWWIAFTTSVIASAVVVESNAHDRAGLIGATVGTALGFCYFVQKQKLDELTLFKSLFTEFNNRYDKMNERLEDIRLGNQTNDSDVRKTLVGYFNLCAEEYLFYQEGFIHQAVWRSWCMGMLYYLTNERIQEIWDDEVRQDSYYGLTKGIIKAGANLPRNSHIRKIL